MSSSESKVSPPQAPEPASAALSLASLPDWVPVYLASLRETFLKSDSARAAGVDLVTVAKLRAANPAFAAEERDIMSAFADVLEDEARRRVTKLPVLGPDGKIQRPLGSDRLLLRLMEHCIPGFARAKNSAPSRNTPASPEPAAADPIETAAAQNPPFPEALLKEFPFLRPIRYPRPSDVRELQNQFVSLYSRARLLDQRRAQERTECDKLRKEQQTARAERDQLKQRTRKLEEALTAARVPIPASDTSSIDEKTRALWLRPAAARPLSEDGEGPAPSSFAPIADHVREAEKAPSNELCSQPHCQLSSEPANRPVPQSSDLHSIPPAPNISENTPPPSNHDHCYKVPKGTLYQSHRGKGRRDTGPRFTTPSHHPP